MKKFYLFFIIPFLIFGCSDKDNKKSEVPSSSLSSKDNKTSEINGEYINYGLLYKLGDNLKQNGYTVKYSSNKREKNGYTRFEAYKGSHFVGSLSLNYDFNNEYAKRYMYISIKCLSNTTSENCIFDKDFVLTVIDTMEKWFGLPKRSLVYLVETDKNKFVRLIIGKNPPVVFTLYPEKDTPKSIDVKIYEFNEVKDWYLKNDGYSIIKQFD